MSSKVIIQILIGIIAVLMWYIVYDEIRFLKESVYRVLDNQEQIISWNNKIISLLTNDELCED